METDLAASPTSGARKVSPTTPVIPLDSETRQIPVHPELPGIKVPKGDLPPQHYHPITCQPFTTEDFQHHKLQHLQKQYSTPAAALEAQQEAVKEVRQRMEETEQKTREIDREKEEKEKMREVERKVYQKQGKGVTGKK